MNKSYFSYIRLINDLYLISDTSIRQLLMCSDDGDAVLSLTQDKEDLDGRVAMLGRQVAALETEKLSAEDHIVELEHQAETLEQEANDK